MKRKLATSVTATIFAATLLVSTSFAQDYDLMGRGAAWSTPIQGGKSDTVYLVERWKRWEDLDSLLTEKVVPALPLYNQLLKRPFDPVKDTLRIHLSHV